MKIEIDCLECGKQFEVYQSEVDRGGGKFCSTDCGYENKRNRVNVICAKCDVEFETRLYYLGRGGGKYCSLSCSNSNRASLLKGHKQSDKHIQNRIKKGEDHYAWRGGMKIQNGYRFIKVGKGYKPEHRIIAEKALGRLLERGEIVHHFNGDRLDNRNKNLLVCTKSYHQCLHRKMSSLYMQEHFS